MTVLQEVRNGPEDISGPNENMNTNIDNSSVDKQTLSVGSWRCVKLSRRQ